MKLFSGIAMHQRRSMSPETLGFHVRHSNWCGTVHESIDITEYWQANNPRYLSGRYARNQTTLGSNLAAGSGGTVSVQERGLAAPLTGLVHSWEYVNTQYLQPRLRQIDEWFTKLWASQARLRSSQRMLWKLFTLPDSSCLSGCWHNLKVQP